MSGNNWISPVRIVDMNILGVNLAINDASLAINDASLAIDSQLECFLRVTSSCGALEKADGDFFCGRSIEVSCDWGSGEERALPAFSASCKIGITISVSESALGCANKDEVETFLAANAVSLAYGKARSVIEGLTAESAAGRRVLPAIDPYKLLESLTGRGGE